MRILYLDCAMGAAGDMLGAALYELLDPPAQEAFLARMNSLGLPGVRVAAEPAVRCGIHGTRMRVSVDGVEEEAEEHHHHHDEHHHHHEHHDEHEHHEHHHDEEHHHEEHHHHHEHHGLGEIRQLVSGMPLPEPVRRNVLEVYGLIAEAESHAHGVPVEQIHFHEVGALDAVADVTAACLLLEELRPDRIMASPVHVGAGHVHCAHGILPVPAPATAHILQGVPIYGGEIASELCTPTGAALLKHFATAFGPMPAMRVERIGYGMGQKEFVQANCLRAMLGEADDEAGEQIVELKCNLDDMTAEGIGYAVEALLDAGALDVFTVPVGMKKSRPGTMLCVLCREEKRPELVRLLFRHTSTLGVRAVRCGRQVLRRQLETLESPWGAVRRKVSEGQGVRRIKIEYEDAARIARENDLPLDEVLRRLDALDTDKKQ